MNKYDIIYRNSFFVIYLLILIEKIIGISFLMKGIWGEMTLILVIIVFLWIYQITYIIYLRKKSDITFSKSIANGLLYVTYNMDISIIYWIIDGIIFGNNDSRFTNSYTGFTYLCNFKYL